MEERGIRMGIEVPKNVLIDEESVGKDISLAGISNKGYY
mgnify:CR=1 FL=1